MSVAEGFPRKMKCNFLSLREISSLSVLAALAWFVSASALLAQTATEVDSMSDLRVIESYEVKLPNRSIFYQRVAPPTSPPKPAPTPVPVVPLSLAGRAAKEARLLKKHEVLMIFATVYNREVTQVRWLYAGKTYRAFSNVDFNYLAGVGWIETTSTVYSLILGVDSHSHEREAADRAAALAQGVVPSVPSLREFNPSRTEYRFVPGDSVPPPEAVAGIEALHRHFDAHRTELVVAYERRLAEQAERERQFRENPPKPKDTVINFYGRNNSRTEPANGGDGE